MTKNTEKVESTKEAEANKSFMDHVNGLGKRLTNAWENSKQGSSWKEKLALFVAGFFTEVKELNEEEKAIDKKETEEAAEFLKNTDKSQLTDAVKKTLVGDFNKLDAPNKDTVTSAVTAGMTVFDKLDADKKSEVMRGLDILIPEEGEKKIPMTEERATALLSCGLKGIAELKRHFESKGYSEADIENYLIRLNESSKNGVRIDDLLKRFGKSLKGFGSSLLTKLPSETSATLVSYVAGKGLDKINPFSKKDPEKEKQDLRKAFAAVLTSTAKSPDKLDKIVELAYEAAAGNAKKMGPKEVAVVIHNVAIDDLEKLSNLF